MVMETTQGTAKKVWYKKWQIWAIIAVFAIVSGVVSTVTFNQRVGEISTYISAGQFETAKRMLDDELKTNRNQERVYLLYADLYIAQDNYKDAISILEQGIKTVSSSKKLTLRLDELKTILTETEEQGQLEKEVQEADKQAELDAKIAAQESEDEALLQNKGVDDVIAYRLDTSTGKWRPYIDTTKTEQNSKIREFTDKGYAIVTANNLFDNVKIYWADNVNNSIEHSYTLHNFGNDGGLMKGYVYVTDIHFNQQKLWMRIEEFTDVLDSYGAYLIKLDDPAISTAKRTNKAVQADNYERAEGSLLNGTELYSIDIYTGDVSLAGVVVKFGLLSTIIYDTFYGERTLDTPDVLNNYYIKK